MANMRTKKASIPYAALISSDDVTIDFYSKIEVNQNDFDGSLEVSTDFFWSKTNKNKNKQQSRFTNARQTRSFWRTFERNLALGLHR